MASFIPSVRGSVKIEVIRNGMVVKAQQTPNTLVLEAPKIMLGNIIGPNLTGGDTANFTNTDSNRPTIRAGGYQGPSSKLSVNYLRLGYVEGTDEVEPISVSANDLLPIGATLGVTKLLTGVQLGEYSVQFICSFEVTDATANRNYFEAALLCPALSEFGTTYMPDPEQEGTDYNEANQVMFAHQTHTPIQASSGSTIRYTWTITMQEPSDA